jgi:hypothetical protein
MFRDRPERGHDDMGDSDMSDESVQMLCNALVTCTFWACFAYVWVRAFGGGK